MGTYIAFLRAINVGKRRVKMDRLRGLFVEMGFAKVATFIASGNVIFGAETAVSATLPHQIETTLETGLGYWVDTFIRTPSELQAVVDDQPFSPDQLTNENHTIRVGFLAASLDDDAQARLQKLTSNLDTFHVQGNELYWLCQNSRESAVSNAKIERAIKVPTTLRNIRTLERLLAKVGR
ncbi:MAG: DUF1697 domain-containing protein [Chloroflexota bacterium]